MLLVQQKMPRGAFFVGLFCFYRDGVDVESGIGCPLPQPWYVIHGPIW